MSVRLQILMGLLVIVLLAAIVMAVRSGRLEFKFSLPWMILLVILLVMDIFPRIAELLARLVGIELPVNLLLVCGLAFALILIFSLTIAVSRLTERQKKLVQEIALLKKRVEELESGAGTDESTADE